MGLSCEQIEEVRKEAEKYKAATGQVGLALTTLWQAHIDMTIATGEVETVDEITKMPDIVAWGDKNSNCPCGARLEPGQEVINPIRG